MGLIDGLPPRPSPGRPSPGRPSPGRPSPRIWERKNSCISSRDGRSDSSSWPSPFLSNFFNMAARMASRSKPPGRPSPGRPPGRPSPGRPPGRLSPGRPSSGRPLGRSPNWERKNSCNCSREGRSSWSSLPSPFLSNFLMRASRIFWRGSASRGPRSCASALKLTSPPRAAVNRMCLVIIYLLLRQRCRLGMAPSMSFDG